MTGEGSTFSVLQFNAWLLAFPFFAYSDDYLARRRALPSALGKMNADIISLQEVWMNRDKVELEKELRRYGYTYFLYTRHWFGLGDGMFLASKFPLKRFKRGRPFKATQLLETVTAKRVVAAEIEIPGLGELDFYQTHIGSVIFDQKKQTHNALSRRKLLVQLLEVSEFIRSHRKSESAILAGDLNLHYQVHEGERGHRDQYTLEYTHFMEGLRATGLHFENSFLAANGMDVSHSAVPTFSQANPYAKKGDFASYPEETLDYIFYTPKPGLAVKSSEIIFREHVSESVGPLSDHYGLMSVFEVSSREKR